MTGDGSILLGVIYGNLDQDEHDTLIKHEYAKPRVERLTYNYGDMGYYKRMCNESSGW